MKIGPEYTKPVDFDLASLERRADFHRPLRIKIRNNFDLKNGLEQGNFFAKSFEIYTRSLTCMG